MDRYIFVRRGCPHCRDMLRVINKVNLKLPIGRQIKIIECSDWEEFGMKYPPLMAKFEKDGINEGFPFFYMGGIIIEPAPTPEVLMSAVNALLKEEYII